jgi:hypothetical protein
MRFTRLLIMAGSVSILLSASVSAETGMLLVTTGTTFADLRVGNVVRIDIQNDVVVNTTASLGYGVSPRFSPDGQKICFLLNGNNTVQIINVNGGAIRSFSVAALPGDGGTLSWTDNGIWVGVNGRIVKYDTLGTQLSVYTTANYEQRGMVSHNEITGGAVYINGSWKPRVYQMRSHTNLSPTTTGDGCSVCPNHSGTLLTNNLQQSSDGIHRAMRILDTNGTQVYYFYLKDITKFTATSYHADMQTWSSNSDDWILIPAGEGGTVPDQNCSPCLYNVKTAQKICAKDNSGTSNHWQPFDYYSGWIPSTTNPALQLSPSSLSFSADSGAANPVNQTVTASTANGTLQGLTVTDKASWLTATPSGASGASVSITNSVTIAGLAPNTYYDTITVATTNAGTKTYIATLTIKKPAVTQVLTSMSISPAKYTVAAGSSVNYLATCKDQSGNYITGASVAWSASGGGTIGAATGIYTAGATPTHGPHLIIAVATAGTVTKRDTALLMVSRKEAVHKRIDCGSNTLVPAGWETDDAYVTGGSDLDNAATITTTGVTAAAPANVYKSVRRGNPHSYRVGGLPAGNYTIRMHFVDSKDTARLMSYSILGVNVLRDFRIVPLAGAINKALVLDFNGVVQDTNGIPISCSAVSGDVFEAGFEVLQNDLKVVTLLSPLGGNTFTAGQSMQIKFCTDTVTLRQIFIELSVNNGLTYGNFTGAYGIKITDYGSTWGTYNWTIPDSIDLENLTRVSTASTRCRIRVRPYTGIAGGNDYSDSAFTIRSKTSTILDGKRIVLADHCRALASGRGLTIYASSQHPFSIDIFSLEGKLLHTFNGTGSHVYYLPVVNGTGIALVRMNTKNGPLLVKTLVAGE